MSDKKGFTIMEIIVVMVIVGVLATISVSVYNTMFVQGAAKAARNNLIAIYNAQRNYYFTNGTYCISSKGVCNSTPSVNNTLSLNITDTNFAYTCFTNPFGPTGYACYATNISNPSFLLTVTNAPIVLPGGTPPLNPSCQSPSNPAYCPMN